jgi:hypothetical protein
MLAQYLRVDAIFTACQTAHPAAVPPLWPEDDIIGQLAVASLLKQGEVFEVPLTRKGDFSWPVVREPHIIVRRHTTRWTGGPQSRALCVPKAPESTLVARLVADLRECERLDALDGARVRLVSVLRRGCGR